MRISLKNFIVPSIPLAVFLIGSCIVLWMSAFVGARYSTFTTQNTTVVETIQSVFQPNSLMTNLVCIVLTLLNAFLVAQINNRFTIIRTRTFLPIFIFALLIGVWNGTHVAIGSHIGLTLIIFALFYFFSMSRDRQASEESFMGSFLISIGSLMITPFIFIIPVCWIGFMMFQSLSLKTFLASVLGMLSPWILYLSANYLFKPEFNFSQLFNLSIGTDISISTISLPEIIYSISISLIMIISLVNMFSISNRDAINTRNKLNFLLLMLISLVILALVFRNQFVSFLPLIALVYSLLISHPLTLKQNNFNGILFLVFCLINLAFVISKYFIF
jgi:hypothetical protein